MKEGNRMKPSADTSLNWYFYILYSAFIWGYVVVRLLCGYSWDTAIPATLSLRLMRWALRSRKSPGISGCVPLI